MLIRDKNTLALRVKNQAFAFGAFALDGRRQASKKEGTLYGVGENCAVEKGALCVGVGVTPLESDGNRVLFIDGSSPAKQFFPVWDKDGDGKVVKSLGVLTENGNFYARNDEGGFWQEIRGFGSKMHAFTAVDEDGELTTALVGYAGVYFYDKRKGLRNSGVQRGAPVGCYFLGRVFCAEQPFTLAFSAPFAPLDFTDGIDGGGRIKLPSDRGELVDITPFKNKIFLFFERGISVLTPTGAVRDFQIKDTVYRGGKILQGSVGVVNSRSGEAFFLAEDGAYRFDGERCLRVCENLKILPKRAGQVCNHAVFENTYYAVYESENGEKRGLVIDGQTAEGYFAFAVEGLSEYCGGAVGLVGNCVQSVHKDGELPSGAERVFRTGGLAFGEAGLKCLQRLIVYGEGEAELLVGNGKKTKRFALDLREGEACAKVFLRGRKFSVALRLKEDARVTGIWVSVEKVAGIKERG